MNKLTKFLTLTVLTFSFIGCNKEDEKPAGRRTLVQAVSLFTRDASELRNFITASGIDLPVSSLEYDVEVFRVTYETIYQEETITASGLVILPKSSDNVGMISFQHGTIAAHSQAPTALPLSSTELILYSALASPGFVAVIPDYIGFGESKEQLHPYYVESVTASSIIDMLVAAQNLAEDQGINFNGRLFLAGYSQGGYATMATHKSIEQDGLTGFDLVASFPAAGGYDVKGMQEAFFAQETYSEPFYMAFVALAYRETYNWTQPLSELFKEPYASIIPSLFDGTKNGGQINEQLTPVVADFIQEDLRTNIDTDPKYTYLVDAFEDNSLLDWIPTVPLYMYHGTADVTVFYQNSIDTYNTLIDNGASPSVVTFTPLEGATHGSGAIPYIESFVPKILDLR